MLVGNGYWDRELEKIEVEGDDLYLPTAPGKLVKGIEIDSGIPLQSAAKVPIMITFDVVEKDGDPNEIHCQKCIFKVGFTPWASCQEGVCTCAVSYYFQTHELCAHRIQNMCCIAAAHCYLLKHAKCKLFTCSSLVAVKFRNADLSHLWALQGLLIFGQKYKAKLEWLSVYCQDLSF